MLNEWAADRPAVVSTEDLHAAPSPSNIHVICGRPNSVTGNPLVLAQVHRMLAELRLSDRTSQCIAVIEPNSCSAIGAQRNLNDFNAWSYPQFWRIQPLRPSTCKDGYLKLFENDLLFIWLRIKASIVCSRLCDFKTSFCAKKSTLKIKSSLT